MRRQSQRPWVLLSAAVGLLLVALVLLYVTAPNPTVLTVRVVDAEAGVPVQGAAVRARSRSSPALPTATSDETGLARFENLPPDRNYIIRVQKVDYDLAFQVDVMVPEAQETEVTVPLAFRQGGRLIVGLDTPRVTEIDTASLLVVRTVRLPDWKQEPVQWLRFHPSGDWIYTVSGVDGCVLDRRSLATLYQFVVEEQLDTFDIPADGQYLSVVSASDNGPPPNDSQPYDARSLPSTHVQSRLDAQSGDLLTQTLTADPALAPLLLWQPDDTSVYMLEPSSRLLWRLRAGPEQVLAEVPTGSHPVDGYLSPAGQNRYTWSSVYFEFLHQAFWSGMNVVPGLAPLPQENSTWALAPDGTRLYVLDAELGTLSIISTDGREPPIVVAVGSRPVAMVLSQDGNWAYVANQESQSVSVVYLPSDTVLLTIPVPGPPHSLALWPG